MIKITLVNNKKCVPLIQSRSKKKNTVNADDMRLKHKIKCIIKESTEALLLQSLLVLLKKRIKLLQLFCTETFFMKNYFRRTVPAGGSNRNNFLNYVA